MAYFEVETNGKKTFSNGLEALVLAVIESCEEFARSVDKGFCTTITLRLTPPLSLKIIRPPPGHNNKMHTQLIHKKRNILTV